MALQPLVLALALVGAPAVPSAPVSALVSGPPAGPTLAQEGRQSLEDLLRQAREARKQRLQALGPEVARIVSDLEELKIPTRTTRTASLQRALLELGPAAAPLMTRFLFPGERPTRSEVFRAELMAEVLRDLSSPVITDDLIRRATEGSALERVNALTALTGSPEPRRVTGPIQRLAGDGATIGLSPEEGAAVQAAAFQTLAALGTPEGIEFIRARVSDENPAVAGAALDALRSAPLDVSSAAVLQVLASPAATRLAAALAGFYGANEELLDDLDHSRALGEVAVNPETSSEDRIELFDILRETDAKVGTPVKRKIDDYTNFARSDVRSAALKLLARMKDRSARKELLSELGEPGGDQAFYQIQFSMDRARLLHQIGDYGGAVKDWRQALQLSQSSARNTRNAKEMFIGIAQSLARQKKFREAKQYLEDAPISLRELQALSTRRDFRKMMESRYRDAFHLDD